jgi:hypothetical protein
MRKLAATLFLSIIVNFSGHTNAQTVNNATVNIIGNSQNVIITQSGAGHSVNLSLSGDNIPVSVTQSGTNPQSFNLNITCYSNCSSNPTVVNQY